MTCKARLFALVLITTFGCDRGTTAGEQRITGVHAARATGELPKRDPNDARWREAPEHVARLLLQDVTEPRLLEGSTDSVRIRALTDGSWLAVRLEWSDARQDDLVGPGRFSDAAAIQFPIASGRDLPDPAMGQEGRRVRIAYWRAAWQVEGDPLERLRPNATTDHYPYEAAAEGERERMETQYAPAKAVGNPMARRPEGAPVQPLIAEGYGTLSPDPDGSADGGGAWENDRWAVVVAVPLSTATSEALRAGARTQIAVAIWNGGEGNVGSRKMRTAWISLSIEGEG